jgi:hypothetical protein
VGPEDVAPLASPVIAGFSLFKREFLSLVVAGIEGVEEDASLLLADPSELSLLESGFLFSVGGMFGAGEDDLSFHWPSRVAAELMASVGARGPAEGPSLLSATLFNFSGLESGVLDSAEGELEGSGDKSFLLRPVAGCVPAVAPWCSRAAVDFVASVGGAFVGLAGSFSSLSAMPFDFSVLESGALCSVLEGAVDKSFLLPPVASWVSALECDVPSSASGAFD